MLSKQPFDRFALISAVLLLFCSSLFADPLIVAHRGASAEAPENTIPAFELAWEQGADAIEGDFHLTKDGHIVCVHDDNTKKVAGKDVRVRDTRLADLKALDVGSHHGGEFKDVRIPTLAEVIQTIPQGKKLYLEVKCGPEIVPSLLEQIKKSELEASQVVYISFKEAVIKALKEADPRCKAYWLYSFKRQRPKIEDLLGSLREMKADGLSSNMKIPAGHILGLQRAGFEWHVWTVNDEESAERAAEMGVKSITTDKPALLKK